MDKHLKKSFEEFEEYKKNNKLPTLVKPSTISIYVDSTNVNNLNIIPGKYYISNCPNHASVQYDSLVEGDEYEIWNLCEGETFPRRHLSKKGIENVIIEIYHKFN